MSSPKDKERKEKQEAKAEIVYIKRLGEILTRIEKYTDEGNKEKANTWYSYLQGFIKASQILK